MTVPASGRTTEPALRARPGEPVSSGPAYSVAPTNNASLVDILDRLLAGGVAVCGDLELSIADVPLVRIDLRALIAPAVAPQSSAAPDGGRIASHTIREDHHGGGVP